MKLGHFNFWAETELKIFKALIKNYNQISKFSTSIMITTNSNQFQDHLCKKVFQEVENYDLAT